MEKAELTYVILFYYVILFLHCHLANRADAANIYVTLFLVYA